MIYISQDLDLALEEVKRDVKNFTIIDSGDREFLIEDAKEAIERAYITTPELEKIILVSPKFSTIAQNRLLKVIEEPPKNKEFILITKSKASLLPTIKSRLPIKHLSKKRLKVELNLNLESLTEEDIYKFLKERQKISKLEAKNILETIFLDMVKSNRYRLDDPILNHFSNSMEALEVGASPIFVISGVILKLLKEK